MITKKPRQSWRLPLTLLIACSAFYARGPQPAFAALACGPSPEISPGEVAREIKNEIADTAKRILQAPASINLRGFVTTQRRELRHKYADVDKTTLDSDLLWVTCQTLSKDPTLDATVKFDEYSSLYLLMTEPIDKSAPAAE